MDPKQANSNLANQVAHYFAHVQELKASNAELLEALEDAKFRLYGAGPSTDPLYAKIRDAIAKETAR